MKKPLDRFSIQADAYKKYRPVYPSALYAEILQHVTAREKCWDCATGNGQVAEVLSSHFRQVEASDISKNQLAQAPNVSNLNYSIQPAERTYFEDDEFDLITVGQAVHWFDFLRFNAEVKRVGKPGGIVAIWGYGLLKIAPKIDQLTTEFDAKIVGPYWDIERKHIDNHYASIPFDFKAIKVQRSFCIEETWDLNRLNGYFNSWSCVQNYKQRHNGENPVFELMERIRVYWKKGEEKKVNFPIFLRIGRID